MPLIEPTSWRRSLRMPLYARGDGPPELTVSIPDCARCFTLADLRDIPALILDDAVETDLFPVPNSQAQALAGGMRLQSAV